MYASNVIMCIVIEAIASVEGNRSGGYADGGRSYGVLCITEGCVSDVNRKFGTKYKWPEDMKSYAISSDVFIKYTSSAKDIGEAAAMWNKGRHGKNKKSAKIYSIKVLKRFRSILINRVGVGEGAACK